MFLDIQLRLPHFVNQASNSTCEDVLTRWTHQTRMVLAFQVRMLQTPVRLGAEIVEVDGAKTLTHKKTSKVAHSKRQRRFAKKDVKPSTAQSSKPTASKKRAGPGQVHHGRCLVLAGRSTHKTVWQPLKPKATKKGAPGPPETTKEVSRLLAKHLLPDSSLAASDAGHGIVRSFKDFGVPVAPARHSVDEVTPLITMNKTSLTQQQQKTAKKLAVRKRPSARVTSDSVSYVGGDNVCESKISSMKRTLRRTQLLGRSAPSTAHIDSLQAIALQERPGLQNALDAYALFRACRAGKVGCDPRNFLNSDTDFDWLYFDPV
eukprot:Skav230921  [mRNA]  locus=scaffold2578:108692:109645:+ [translate_table: standard]